MKLTNPFGHAILVLVRHPQHGRDSVPVQLEPGDSAAIDFIDSGHDIIIKGVPYDGEVVSTVLPTVSVTKVEPEVEATQLNPASEDELKAIIGNMVDSKEGLSDKGVPKMEDLNKRLNAAGFASIKAVDRDAVFQPA